MKMLLIGHRGTGKSSLLQRLQIYSSMRGNTIPVFDLDREIEKSAGAKIQDIFELMGEKNFRVLERTTYQHVLKRSDYILSLGAGFQLDQIQIDPDVQVVWVKRKSDQLGRIFLDRPRLNKEVSPLAEYQERYEARQHLYEKHATWVYDLPEGLSSPSEAEANIFFNHVDDMGGLFTLDKQHALNFENFKNRIWKWDFDFFELRDDLLTEQQMQGFFALVAKENLLLSFRSESTSSFLIEAAKDGYHSDWALELGICPWGTPSILSLHQRKPNQTLQEAIQFLQDSAKPGQHLKLAVEIHDYQELEVALKWQALDPIHRSFLPRSKTGKWNWVRLWLKDRQKLNFIREGVGQSLDQPTVFEWMNAPSKPQSFAAVLGHPVQFSFSPIEHGLEFQKKQMPFFAIDITEDEWPQAIKLLTQMGLRSAAVTSPLKKLAFLLAGEKSELCLELKSANTLTLNGKIWHAENTDFIGLRELLHTTEYSSPVCIWGGGGTLPVIQKLLPNSIAYSTRTRQRRDTQEEVLPETLIWAASPNAQFPPDHWKPSLIIDLNYREDSQAKEYCQKVGARYISGLYMFKAQARAQKEVWGNIDDSE